METAVTEKDDKISVFKKVRGAICHNCPLCRHARNKPESFIGKILHSKKHADNCPMWKAEKELYPDAE